MGRLSDQIPLDIQYAVIYWDKRLFHILFDKEKIGKGFSEREVLVFIHPYVYMGHDYGWDWHCVFKSRHS